MIFKENQTEGMGNFSPDYLADMVIKNGYLYYAGIRDYKLYLMRRSLENPSKEEILGEAFLTAASAGWEPSSLITPKSTVV